MPELLGEDPSDIARIWSKLVWAGASVGRSGLATRAIAAFDIALWDLRARRADLPLAKLLGGHRAAVRCYNISGGFLPTPIEQVLDNVMGAMTAGIGGIKIKVGRRSPTTATWRWPRTSRWRSTPIWLRPTAIRPGWSTSTGSSRCSSIGCGRSP